MKQNTTLILLVLSITLFSCKNKPAETIEPESDLIEITKAQFQSENMEFGEPANAVFSDVVHFTGSIIPSVQGQAQISLPVEGLILRIYCNPGQFVSKGALLFDVSGNEFVEMQREFAESAVLVKRLKTDFERVKQLNDENIGTIKELILAESAYNAENVKYNTLKIKLENIGLDIAKIEGGSFYSTYTLKAPLKGYVNSISTTIGQYIQPMQTIAEIIDAETFQLKLSVFEKDIQKLHVGQKVEFQTAGINSENYRAKLSSVGKAINQNTMAIDCFAEIENLKSVSLVGGQYVEGDIIVATDTVLALPGTAVVSVENETFVLALEKEADDIIFLKKMPIQTGRKNSDFVEVSEFSGSKKLLLKGGYNIQVE
jgi:cobalt-zinc-cadmium efflux system membrane fusion protein